MGKEENDEWRMTNDEFERSSFKLCNHCFAAFDTVADFYRYRRVERQINLGARAKTDHAEALTFREFVADFRPADDASRNSAGDLPHYERRVLILDRPRAVFVEPRRVGMARIEEFAGIMLH